MGNAPPVRRGRDADDPSRRRRFCLLIVIETMAGVDEVPDFVFLAHVVDVMQSLHVPFVLRTFASTPFSVQLFLLPMWPFAFLVMLAMWAWSKTFVISCCSLRGRRHQMWAVPRYGFQVRALIWN